MGGIFSSPKSIKPPPVPPPPGTPDIDEDETKKAVRPRSGRARTIITGELEPQTAKKSLLG